MSRRSLPVTLLAILAVAKFTALLVFGPQSESDSAVYLDFAYRILNDTRWWRDAGLTESWLPVTAFRPPGYPALLAVAIAVAGKTVGLYLVMAAQIGLGLIATVWVWRVARGVLGLGFLGLLVPCGFAVSIGFLYDQSVMTDSLFNSLFVLLFAIPAVGILESRAATFRAVLAAGILAMLAHSMRGVTLYLLIVLAPIWGLWFWRTATGIARGAAMAAVLLLPIAVLTGTVMAWNASRTGRAFYVTNPPVPLQPLAKAAARGHRIFDGDTVIDREARATFKTYGYDEVLVLSDRLFVRHGLNALDAFRMEMGLYFRSWRNHPGAMTVTVLGNISHHQINNFFNVIDVLDEIVHIAANRHIVPSSRELRRALIEDINLAAGLLMMARAVLRVLAWVLFSAFVLGLPVSLILIWRRTRVATPSQLVLAAGWMCYVGYVLMLCALHFVTRFVPAVLPWGLMGALAVSAALMSALAARRRRDTA